MIRRLLDWSLPIQVLLLAVVLLTLSQQGGGESPYGPFSPAPHAEQMVGETRTARVGFAIVDDLRYGGIERGAVVLSEGRLAQARAHRIPVSALPSEVSVETRSGRVYRLRLLAADPGQVTLTVVGVTEGRSRGESSGG